MAMVMVAASALGTLGPVAGVAYAEGISPAAMSAMRALVGASLLGILVLAGRQPSVNLRRLPRGQGGALLLAIVANGVMNLVLFAAYGTMTIAIVMVVFFTYPLQVAIISVLLGRERLTRNRAGALALTVVGLALVLGGRLHPGADVTLVGIALATAAAFLHAVYLLVIRAGFPTVPPVQATSLVLWGGFLISGTAALLLGSGTGAWTASPVAWIAILVAGTLGAALPKVWVIGGVRIVGSTRSAVLMLLEPVTAVIVAALILGQVPSALEVAGAVAVLAAVIIVQRADPGAEVIRQAVGSPPR